MVVQFHFSRSSQVRVVAGIKKSQHAIKKGFLLSVLISVGISKVVPYLEFIIENPSTFYILPDSAVCTTCTLKKISIRK